MGPYAPADTLLGDWAAHVGRPAPTSGTVEKITGRPGRSFARWAADHAGEFSGQR